MVREHGVMAVRFRTEVKRCGRSDVNRLFQCRHGAGVAHSQNDTVVYADGRVGGGEDLHTAPRRLGGESPRRTVDGERDSPHEGDSG